MAASRAGVRAGRSALTVAVTGAGDGLGEMFLDRLVAAAAEDLPPAAEHIKKVVAVDARRGSRPGVTWRVADVRDPALRSKLAGVDVLVHLATDRDPDAPAAARRGLNVPGTDMVLSAAAAAGVRRVVLLTSAMVYGAGPDNPVPLPEDAPPRADADLTLVGDWVEMERLADEARRAHPSLQLVVLRPASIVGPVSDALLPRLLEAPRLLAIKGTRPHWQFCHVDDLMSALLWATTGLVDAVVTVGCEGWLEQAEVEEVSGLRSVVVPAAVAFATAERLHRVGVLPAPASELRYLAHPWVVGSQRLREAGWKAEWDNRGALTAHVAAIAEEAAGERRGHRRDATRAAAGAAVAIVGTVAIARARRRRRG